MRDVVTRSLPDRRRRQALVIVAILHGAMLLAWQRHERPAQPPLREELAVAYLSLLKTPARTARPVRGSSPSPRIQLPRRPAPERPPSPSIDDAAPLPPREAPAEPAAQPQDFDAASVIALAKRQAGAIDRELRRGASGVPEDPDTPMSRFVRGVEGAAIERSMAEQREHFVGPDGTRYTSITFKGSKRCYMSGPVNDPHGRSGGPTEIQCPGKQHSPPRLQQHSMPDRS